MRHATAARGVLGGCVDSVETGWKKPRFTICPAPPVPLLLSVAQLRLVRFTLCSPGSVELAS
jgi:hypothetical protein